MLHRGNTKLGEKTNRLQTLLEAGFAVPRFVAISTDDIELPVKELVSMIVAKLDVPRYAVRSSALVEDAQNFSMAGQFMTRLDVSKSELGDALDAVRRDAKAKLGSLEQFSMIVQEFIEPDLAGITFTRNPNGDRETIVEYHEGRGDAVVSGQVKPKTIAFYRSQPSVKTDLPGFDKVRETFFKIEQLFGFPQDIEWCVKDSVWYILQSRPITSLTEAQVQSIERLELELPEGRFYFAKTEVCDVAPHPSAATMELLRMVYAKRGPVDRAYTAFGIAYHDTDFLKVISGDLYVDRERELQSLFPSHSYFAGRDLTPKPFKLTGFWQSMKNMKRLKNLRGNVEVLTARCRQAYEARIVSESPEEANQAFLRDYELIFTINLLAGSSIEALKRVLPASITLTEALSYFPADLPAVWPAPKNLVGNTLELTDTSTFISSARSGSSVQIPKAIPERQLREAQLYLRLREYGRWLALKHINHLRNLLGAIEAPAPITAALPTTITDTFMERDDRKPLGVSAGQVTGKLVSDPHEEGILVVSALTPELAQYTSTIKGVIADHGGLLSHFAIIAREIGLPVVVNYPIHTLELGKQIKVDGSTGEVVVLEE